MDPILFYGVPSGCSFGSIVALEWLGRPYRLCRIAMPEIVTGEVYRRINPVAETPALMTAEGEVIAESMAILNHLGARGLDSGLAFPQGTSGFDRLNQMLAYLNTSLFNGFSPLWYALEHELEPAARAALRAYGAAKLAKAHADLETMLGGGPWLLGEERSLADAYFAGIARWTQYHDVLDRRDYPGLQRLFEALERDPAVQLAHAVERGEAPAPGPAFRGEISLDEALRQRRAG
jgi:glutathione S-transferase